MNESTKTEQGNRGGRDTWTEMMRGRAQQLIAQALETEVAKLLAAYADHRDDQSWAILVRPALFLQKKMTTLIAYSQIHSNS